MVRQSCSCVPRCSLARVDRPQVAMLGEWAPSLEELYAADNSVSDVVDVVAASTSGNTKVEGFRRLKSLDLSETGLTSWEQVWTFFFFFVCFLRGG